MKTRLIRHRFHQIIYSIVIFLFGPILKWMYAFRPDRKIRIDGPFLLLVNHVTAADPVLVPLSFPQQMYIVADEHLMQKGFASRLLQFFFDPIVRRKGESAVTAVKETLACLKSGFNVCIFPEGTCSFDGNNSPMLPTIGKLAKTCGATLVTYRFEGGFFTLPRWGRGIRRGKYTGHVENIYPPEMLRQMSPAEINDHIAQDLKEDAYARIQADPVDYKSRRRAEWLESGFFLCPSCLRVGTLHTSGETIACEACGLSGTLDSQYRLHGFPFSTLEAWEQFENEWLVSQVSKTDFAFSDDDAILIEADALHRRKRLCSGPLRMDRDSLTIGSYSFPFSEMAGMEIVRRNLLVFSTSDSFYQITGAKTLCSRKYFQFYRVLKGESLS
ncbi:MAG: 1-acyl-sn-glycerol-3-phosphate acyltransferase [Clostridia bacterium]|nr:1-acyl-sn-glycerol-3-phosphate acyltransferase [Clostridia bacterium]